MQDKINSFNAAFVDLAAAYVRRLANKIAGNETHTAEPPGGPLRWGTSLADEMRVVNLLAATVGKMQTASGGEIPQGSTADNLEFLRDFLEGKTRWNFPEGTTFNVTVDANGTSGMETTQKGAEKEPPAGPEPVTLGPGTSYRMENVPASGKIVTDNEKKADVIPALKDFCKFCKELSKRGGIWATREWGKDAAALEQVISILSELEEIREVRIPAGPNTPGVWELMRDILAGKRPAPEGTVFDVVIDMTGNPQAIRKREELGYTARSLTLTMPGGDTVKLNSAAEAYGLAACIENMAVRVWPEATPGKEEGEGENGTGKVHGRENRAATT